jgi:hypothetical protein
MVMEIPQPLLDDIAAGKCLPFIGAGFSLNAKLPGDKAMPDWPGLTKLLAQTAGVPEKMAEPEVASAYERLFGRVQLIEAIRQALHTDVVEPGSAHRTFAQLPFDTIYTTNFDLLLEDAYSLIRRPYRSIVGELQMPFHGGPLTPNIVKMHGDLRHEEHMIITREDYDGYLTKHPVISTHLSAMLITRTALFIGYSLSDPDFNHIREVVRSRLGRFQRMSYIVQFNQSEAKTQKTLGEHLHVLNFKVKRGESIDDKFAEFFLKIQEELDTRAGKRFRASKPEIFEEISQDTLEATSRAPDSSALLTSSSNLCFVLMPFGEPFDDIYRQFIYPTIIQAGLEALRADEVYAPGSIMEQIRSAIQQSRIIVADLTGRNPNVLYELGIAQTLGKPTVLLTQDMADVPFDVRHLRVIVYGDNLYTIRTAQDHLAKSIQLALGQDRLDEARRLIDNGMYRAAVAMLGVLLEHSLRQLVVRNDLVDIRLRDHFARQLTMGRMIEMLAQSQIITQQESHELREAVAIRNRAVHELEEPKKQDAQVLLESVQTFIRKRLNSAE